MQWLFNMFNTKVLSSADISIAANALKQGEAIAFPTETVYGLGANAYSNDAVLKIYEAKGRPRFNPLIVHVASLEQAEEIAFVNETAKLLFKTFSPGALTLILPLKNKRISDIALAGLETIGVRIPAHPLALELIKRAEMPLFAPSANRSGHVSPTTSAHVYADLKGRIPYILEGGECDVGVESTILSLTSKPLLLREGGVERERIESLIGAVSFAPTHKILAPGMMASHYAPHNKLFLNATEVRETEALLAFGKPLNGTQQVLNLSPTENLSEAAKNLFSHLRELDKLGRTIKAMPIPMKGLGAALNDRLKRAAA